MSLLQKRGERLLYAVFLLDIAGELLTLSVNDGSGSARGKALVRKLSFKARDLAVYLVEFGAESLFLRFKKNYLGKRHVNCGAVGDFTHPSIVAVRIAKLDGLSGCKTLKERIYRLAERFGIIRNDRHLRLS